MITDPTAPVILVSSCLLRVTVHENLRIKLYKTHVTSKLIPACLNKDLSTRNGNDFFAALFLRLITIAQVTKLSFIFVDNRTSFR